MSFIGLIIFMINVATACPSGYVLTGRPGSGKSSLAIALEMRGEAVIHETAVDVIRYHLAHGHQEPWHRPNFQHEIAALQAMRESKMTADAAVDRYFLDRSAIDCVAYRLMTNGEVPRCLIDQILKSKVGSLARDVFLIEGPPSIEHNEYRQENLEECAQIELALTFVYERLGFRMIPIKFSAIPGRIDQVLSLAEAKTNADEPFGRTVPDKLRNSTWVKQLCAEWLAR